MGKLGLPKGVDVSDADALLTDVRVGKTFYSVAVPRKTGNLPTKAIAAGAETYEEGYHAGNPGGLSAIDADLAVANIKKAVNIFGKVGTLVDLAYAIAQGWLDGLGATVGDFQTNPGTGTMLDSQELNDNSTGATSHADADAIGEYVEVDYGKEVLIKRWRQYGNPGNNEDGVSKIQYWNLDTSAFEDWVTGIPTVLGAWTGLATETPKLTTKIRFICTTVDGQGKSETGELEVIY